MLGNRYEYEIMSKVEGKLWWYQNLHQKVLSEIPKNKDIDILDCGCGTGGLMQFLKQHGYTSVQGFDLDDHAVEFCQQKNLIAKKKDVRSVSDYEGKKFDIIISNDVFYFLTPLERNQVFKIFEKLLKPEGKIILNVPALRAFRGTHDMSVGVSQRFEMSDINPMINGTSFQLIKKDFWPFLLSPIIFFTRLIQRITHKEGDEVTSDLSLPHPLINHILYLLCRLERFLPIRPWGSSLFLVFQQSTHSAGD